MKFSGLTFFQKPASIKLLLFILIGGISFSQCKQREKLPPGDANNGGLILPVGFEAVVVVDSLKGAARHLAVNTNGDIYVKLGS